MSDSDKMKIRSTTVLAVRKDNVTVLAADGQVTQGNLVLKAKATKIRRLFHGKILAGFAGATADAFALFERLDVKLQEYHGNLLRSAVERAKDWRTDRALRRREAMLIVADKARILILTGNGDVVEPDQPVVSIGSGGPYALSAARALVENTDLDAQTIVSRAMDIAADLCIYTNANRAVETLDSAETKEKERG